MCSTTAGRDESSVVAYLDHAATTPTRPEVLEAMLPYLTATFGNPSGAHAVSRRAWAALETAREEVARCVGAQPGEVIFTSGGTEADNLAVRGVVEATGAKACCSAIEHPAVRESVLAGGGLLLPVTGNGVLDCESFAQALDPAVGLVSVMVANHETGIVQPLAEVSAQVRSRAPNAVLHTDAVQAAPWMDLGDIWELVDAMSVSGHKLGAPKGIGALVVREGVRLAPVMRGGPQEKERRPGTQNVAGAIGLAEAMRLVAVEREAVSRRVEELRDMFSALLGDGIPGLVETGACTERLPGHCHVQIPGVESEVMLIALDESGVCASAGPACASGALEPSTVLMAMGRSALHARQCLRFSMGYNTTEAEVTAAAEIVVEAFRRLAGRRGQ